MGTLDLTTPLMLLDKSRLMPASGFSFTLPGLTFITRGLHDNSTHILDIFSDLQTHEPTMWLVEIVQKKSHTLVFIRSKAGLEHRMSGRSQ